MRSLRRLVRDPWPQRPDMTAVGPITVLVAKFDHRYGDAEAARAYDIIVRAGGRYIGVEASPRHRVLNACFRSASDATRAAVEIAYLVIGRACPSENPLAGLRIALYTADAQEDLERSPQTMVLCTTNLLARAEPGQILLTAPTAVVAGPTLPPGIQLLDRGLWTPSPSAPTERIYQMSISGPEKDGIAGSNLGWARRAVHGHGDTPAADVQTVVKSVHNAWQQTLTGRAQLILLSGGRPESRIACAAEAALRLHAEGALVLYGRWVRDAQVPYRAFRDALGFYASRIGTDQLIADLEGWADKIARLLPEVGTRVGGPHLAQAASDVDRARIFEAVETWVRAIAKRTPMVVVLDDAHWAEPASVLLLAHLWHTCRRHRLTLLITGEADAGNPLNRLMDLATHIDADGVERIRL